MDTPQPLVYNGCMRTSVSILTLIAGMFVLPAVSDAAAAKGESEGKQMFHVVSFKFKADAKPEQIKAVEDAFMALKEKIPEIKTLKWGTNVSPEKHDKGFTHCFVLTFANAKDRDAYLVHADHKAFGKVLGPIIEDVFVLDFESK